MDGKRDGIYTVQMTDPDARELLIQTQQRGHHRPGSRVRPSLWEARLPKLYATALALGHNEKLIFSVTGTLVSAFGTAKRACWNGKCRRPAAPLLLPSPMTNAFI